MHNFLLQGAARPRRLLALLVLVLSSTIGARAQSVAKTAVEAGERDVTVTLQVRFLLR